MAQPGIWSSGTLVGRLMVPAGLCVAVGFGATPSFDGAPPAGALALFWWAALAGPFLPLIASFAVVICRPQLSAGPVLALLTLIGFIGAGFGLVVLVAGRPSIWIAQFAVFTALSGGVFCLLRSEVNHLTVHVCGGCLLALSILASLWSVGAGLRAYQHAQDLADGRPYCIAYHGLDRPIRSLSDLRGGWLWTGHDGFKLGDQWYFDALLIIKDGQIYNWSHRAMRFHLLPGQSAEIDRRFIAGPLSPICRPVPDFLARLPIL
ncbi:MAG: hypothetical protein AAGC79_17645 [Pseudomonadota bacterium]